MFERRWTRHRPLFASPVPPEVRKPRIKWRPFFIIWLAIKKMCTVIGAFVLLVVILGYCSMTNLKETAVAPLPQKMVLYIEFGDGFQEMPSGSALSHSFGEAPPTVHEIVDAIDTAAKDPRVAGIMGRLNGGTFTPSQTEEVRNAIKRFRAVRPDRFTSIYSPSYGEGGGGLGRFYLASAFEDRWMQPLGMVAIPGVNAEMPFFRDTLDKIGVKPEFFKRKEFKTAYENLTDNKMSEPNREEITGIVDELNKDLTNDISADLKITPEKFRELVNKGIFTADEAVQEKLINHSDYVDVLVSQITEKLTGDPESDDDIFVDPQTYMEGVGRETEEKNFMKGRFRDANPHIAIVYVTGLIMDSRIGASAGIPGLDDEGTAAADEIAPALLDAADDPNVQAVVMRIDSPGGSPVASETILRAVDKVREKGKPVIVSMGATAASGGYWIAAHADRIFASPTTLTGSIGVVGGKFSGEELWKKLGVKWEGIQWGNNAGLWSINHGFTDTEAERMNAMLDQVYNAFLDRVAKGRKMTTEQVDKIAGGRVWTGGQAIGIGLVDELGGLQTALDYTAVQLGAKDRFGMDVEILPKPLTTLEELMQFLGDQSTVYEGFKFQAAVSKIFSPLMNQMVVLGNSKYSTYEPLKIQN